MSKRGLTIVGLGEALFDVFPDRSILGGAPLNVAVHAHQMTQALGGCGIPASRIGRDDLGRRLVDELAARGVPTFALQHDDQRPTGQVLVSLDGGEPSYQILEDVAWDRLELTDDWKRLAQECDAVCFGTLGQRSALSRATIGQFLQHATRAIRMFDVNLRQHFFTAGLIQESFALATVVKLNERELPQVHRWLAPSSAATTQDHQAGELRAQFNLDAVVLTRGSAGTVLYTASERTGSAPASYPQHPAADSVGAGDACAAGILVGMLQGWQAVRTVELANAAGAFVAAQPGATPRLPRELREFPAGGDP